MKEIYNCDIPGSNLIKSANTILRLLDDREFELSRYLMKYKETSEVCINMVLGKKASLDSIYNQVKDDEDFIELSKMFYVISLGVQQLDVF